ncbi:DUF167 family protein [Sphingomonas sp. KR1UV-12]|uniref:UPF0235 protein Q5H91_12260 n=1 Tax=Sphingomonas aurea TaxID=3063994 RepID=A0ABT9EM02_9SPHN|nr:DUF167 family protein [Sphingomonas sp. KR1UV-12]MDP1027989.1 DUF167 family protein [Sphingomonas sp. KR1UV-12]
MAAWRQRDDGIDLAVRVTPRGGRDMLAAGTDDHLAARLAAAPVDGAANVALVRLIAAHFGVARRDVTLVAGDTARLKRLRVAGDPAVLAKTAAALYEAGS